MQISGLKRKDTVKLTVTLDYVSRWSTWETFRELVQNFLDEDREDGMDPAYEDGFMVLENKGKLSMRNLLLGGGNKRDNKDKRGQFGEGLKLACSVAVRENKGLFIYNDDEIMVPCVAKWHGNDVLGIRIYDAPEKIGKVKVMYEMEPDMFEDMAGKILDLTDYNHKKVNFGEVLFDDERKGHIYAKGIEVSKLDGEWMYGYNCSDIQVDRDRNMVGLDRLRSEVLWVLHSYLTSHVVDKWDYLLGFKGKSEAEFISSGMGTFDSDVELAFESKYDRDKYIPVVSREEQIQVQHFGVIGVIVPEFLYKPLDRKCMTFEHRKHEKRYQVVKVVPRDELSPLELKTLDNSLECLKRNPKWLDLVEKTNVAEFSSDSIEGTFDRGAMVSCIARGLLQSPVKTISVLAHEYAHRFYEEGTQGHEEEMMNGMALIIEAMREELEELS